MPKVERRTADFAAGKWIEINKAATMYKPEFYDLGIIQEVRGDEIFYRSRDGQERITSEWFSTVVPSPDEIREQCLEFQKGWSPWELERRTVTPARPGELHEAESRVLTKDGIA